MEEFPFVRGQVSEAVFKQIKELRVGFSLRRRQCAGMEGKAIKEREIPPAFSGLVEDRAAGQNGEPTPEYFLAGEFPDVTYDAEQSRLQRFAPVMPFCGIAMNMASICFTPIAFRRCRRFFRSRWS